jgi:hypothetical protein
MLSLTYVPAVDNCSRRGALEQRPARRVRPQARCPAGHRRLDVPSGESTSAVKATVQLLGESLAVGSSSWGSSSPLFGIPAPCCAAATIATPRNNDSSGTDKCQIIAFRSNFPVL